MCNNCSLIEQRLEALETFVWQQHIANDCDYNMDGICCADLNTYTEDRLCEQDICTNSEWELRGE